ncbi:hypothetical protein M8C21_014758 [Ambrosia artemisiifolia]|uniref:NAP1-related protein 2 n=1 Tax=Ambrosia artemisiifolia TaxID=4212 RepID=A0AAD5GUQ2_AMBAR|nr:hypothetical protein M8C21_014758 [Ambrosia artemisiifolia]
MVADKGKKPKMTEKTVEEAEQIDSEVVQLIEKMQEVQDELEKIFKHFTSLEVEDFKDVKLGYSISFNFSPNPYFEDTKLTKTFTFLDEGTTKVTATKIKWKEGKGVSNGVCNEKKGNKRCHDSCNDSHEDESFFSWFSGNQENDEVVELNDEVAEIIREDLWANPLTYFNNDDDEEEFEENRTDDSDEEEDQEDDEGN